MAFTSSVFVSAFGKIREKTIAKISDPRITPKDKKMGMCKFYDAGQFFFSLGAEDFDEFSRIIIRALPEVLEELIGRGLFSIQPHFIS
ncbi:MAG: hypothetical protein AAF551_13380, partial [Bacteroidota bacterium]